MTDFNLSGRTVFITGATSGLGRHFAKVLARAGAAVAITGRRQDRLSTLEHEIADGGGRCVAVVLDVTDDTRIPAAFDEAEGLLGPIQILLNNAGMNLPGPVLARSLEEFDSVLRTDLRAPFVLAREAGRRMIARGQGGRIINVASIGSLRVLPGLTAYCIAKAALAMMTQCLAREWARHDIKVNAICPGYVETELNGDWFATEKGRDQIRSFPTRRLIGEQDLDGILLLLASDASRAMTGSLLTIDDAQSL
jgi:NAD(P)-dependent dehydrogenase (short-subunit alcohol dehydrogenase family)